MLESKAEPATNLISTVSPQAIDQEVTAGSATVAIT